MLNATLELSNGSKFVKIFVEVCLALFHPNE
jgi:hypothetical protein